MIRWVLGFFCDVVEDNVYVLDFSPNYPSCLSNKCQLDYKWELQNIKCKVYIYALFVIKKREGDDLFSVIKRIMKAHREIPKICRPHEIEYAISSLN